MSKFIWPSIALYCFFSIFVFYQQLHVKKFQGSSQAFNLALNLSVLAGTVTGFVYLAYYAWTISWWAAAVVLMIGLIAGVAGLVIERYVTGWLVLSVGGFIGWPVSAYYMFNALPSGA